MSYTVTITYTAANDIYNMNKQTPNIKSVAPIPGLSSNSTPGTWGSPSDKYLYAPDDATAPVYNKENLFTNSSGALTAIANLSLLTSSQLRWPKSATASMMNILEAYLIPQIPVYRAWQTFKMTASQDGTTNTFEVETLAEASFYKDAGEALKDYGFTVSYEAVTEG